MERKSEPLILPFPSSKTTLSSDGDPGSGQNIRRGVNFGVRELARAATVNRMVFYGVVP